MVTGQRPSLKVVEINRVPVSVTASLSLTSSLASRRMPLVCTVALGDNDSRVLTPTKVAISIHNTGSSNKMWKKTGTL
jgi:hypothetical protein